MKKITNLIIWITGQSGSGKTTLAKSIKKRIGGIILDGDEMRESISPDLMFSKIDREKHNLRVARLAKIISKDALVIISVIAPFESTRNSINKIIKPIWVYIEKDNMKISKNRPYEIPKKYDIKINFDNKNKKEQINLVVNYLNNQINCFSCQRIISKLKAKK